MTDLGPSIFVAVICLFCHWLAFTSIFDDVGTLPEDNRLIRIWRSANRRPEKYSRRLNVVVAAGIALLVTAIMVVFLLAGSYMTVIGVVELTIAGAWLAYLLKANRGRMGEG